jgi:uridine kinase
MRGDILIINEDHRKAARQVIDLIFDKIKSKKGKYIISVAGESGAGKSEIAASIAKVLAEKNISSFIFQQDDYFVYPPKTNAKMRIIDIRHVGMSEVKLDLIDKELKTILKGNNKIEKPLVIFEEDRIDKETVNLENVKVIIVEGTYVTALKNIDQRVFIDRDLNDTKESRKKRNREKQDKFLEAILLIENKIISPQKSLADIIITKDYDVESVNS